MDYRIIECRSQNENGWNKGIINTAFKIWKKIKILYLGHEQNKNSIKFLDFIIIFKLKIILLIIFFFFYDIYFSTRSRE